MENSERAILFLKAMEELYPALKNKLEEIKSSPGAIVPAETAQEIEDQLRQLKHLQETVRNSLTPEQNALFDALLTGMDKLHNQTERQSSDTFEDYISDEDPF